jgi:hypothetical protein
VSPYDLSEVIRHKENGPEESGPDQNGCQIFDPKRLKDTGSILFSNGKMRTAAQQAGTRLWNGYQRGDQ